VCAVQGEGLKLGLALGESFVMLDVGRFRKFGLPWVLAKAAVHFTADKNINLDSRQMAAEAFKITISAFPGMNYLSGESSIPELGVSNLLHLAVSTSDGRNSSGISSHILNVTPSTACQRTETGLSAFDIASSLKQPFLLAALFKAAVNDVSPLYQRDVLTNAIKLILIKNPESVELLGSVFESLPIVDCAYSKNEITHARLTRPHYCGHCSLNLQSAEKVWRRYNDNGTPAFDMRTPLRQETSDNGGAADALRTLGNAASDLHKASTTAKDSNRWQNDNGFLVQARCIAVPGLVDVQLLSDLVSRY
jgi:hypothetical protein